MFETTKNKVGILSAVAASVCFSLNDVTIKFLSGDYPLHEVVLFRSTFGMIILLSIVVPLQGGLSVLRTNRLGVHLIRGGCVVFANMTFFLALAAMPIADAVAIFFVSPLVITTFSVIFLKESVGPRRWLAVGIGMIGVIVVMRPGSQAFQVASLLPLAAAVGYAVLHILTRRIGESERAVTMTFYILLVFISVSAIIGLLIGDGKFAGSSDPSLDFLFRAWVIPKPADLGLMVLLGLASTAGGYLISQAYRLCEAGLAAPFEYVALPMAIFWGVTVFGEWPDITTWLGVALILSGGLYMFWREAISSPLLPEQRPIKPR